jgi:hypothetical protein
MHKYASSIRWRFEERAGSAKANDYPAPWIGWLSLIECRLFILRRVARI